MILPPLVFLGVPINLFQTKGGGENSHPYIAVSNPLQEILECEIKNYLFSVNLKRVGSVRKLNWN
jgi:hypothetical protein